MVAGLREAREIRAAQADRQLALYEGLEAPGRTGTAGRGRRGQRRRALLCNSCRAREARYGFRDETLDDPLQSRPRALCFDCFRLELDRRHAVAARVRRPPNPWPSGLSLEDRLLELARRRRRAQIAARHALQ